MPTDYPILPKRPEQAPYGFDISAGRALVRNEAEQAVISLAKDLRAEGKSLGAIGKALAARGLLSRVAKPFVGGQILRMLGRPTLVEKGLPAKECPHCEQKFIPKNRWQRFCCALQRMRHSRYASLKAARLGLVSRSVTPLEIFKRSGWKCDLCGRPTPRKQMGTNAPNAPTLNHRKPLASGGSHTKRNLRTACRRCSSKWGRPERAAA